MSDFIYGLDFGTTTTLMAIPTDGMPRVIPIGRDNAWMPSVISVSIEDQLNVGDAATDQTHADQIRSPKSAITQKNFGMLKTPNGKEVSADTAILALLTEVKNRADANGFDPEGQVRMSCPAMWTGEQRKRLADLAKLAGINTDVDNFLDEPIGACVAWWWNNFFNRGKKQTARILVFDLGGGTLDVAVADIYGETIPEITVLAARGINIAGDSLDLKLAHYYESRLFDDFKIEIAARDDYLILRNLIIRASRKVKEELSTFESTTFKIEDPDYSFLPLVEISRIDLESVYRPDLELALSCVRTTIRETYLKNRNHNSAEMAVFRTTPIEEIAQDIQYVVLAGGMSQIPLIGEALRRILPNAITEHVTQPHESTEAIVKGVANRNEFSDLNIHRPNFNFLIRWIDDDEVLKIETLYPAFTPLCEDWEIMTGNFSLGYEQWATVSKSKGMRAEIFLESVGGRKTTLNFAGQFVESIPVKVSRAKKIRFKIHLDGKIIVAHGGETTILRVKEWPYIRWQAGRIANNELKIEYVSDNLMLNLYEIWGGGGERRHQQF